MRAAVTEVETEFAHAHGEQDLETLYTLLTRLNVVLGTELQEQ